MEKFKGFLIGAGVGIGLFIFSGLIAATAMIHPIIPLVIALLMVIGLFGFIGMEAMK